MKLIPLRHYLPASDFAEAGREMWPLEIRAEAEVV